MTGTDDRIRESLELQVGWCRALGSPLYARLLEVAVADYDRRGPVAGVVRGFDGDPIASVLALRFLGGVHRLVLMGLAPDLARHYPSVGGTPAPDSIDADFLATVSEHRGYLTDSLRVAPQTNEVGRSMVLLPGLMVAGEGDRHDIRLLEIGASGGLNLFLDRFRYDSDAWRWGSDTAPVSLRTDWSGPTPPLRPVTIRERRGCDVAPLDVTDPESELRLVSFVWADQPERIERMRGAIGIARDDPPVLDHADAATWLERRLAEPVPRRTLTVVQHSIMWQYVAPPEQDRITAVIDAAGARATRSRSLAHVSFEPAGGSYSGAGPQLRVTRWPGGTSRLVAEAHAHGAWVRWLG